MGKKGGSTSGSNSFYFPCFLRAQEQNSTDKSKSAQEHKTFVLMTFVLMHL
jgi:hypothetical protein